MRNPKDICETNKTMAIHEIHNAGSGSLLANVKPRLFSLLAILALLAAGTTTTPVYATIFSEDFQSLSNGPLAGQGGWTGDSEIRLTTGNATLPTRIVDGHDVSGVTLPKRMTGVLHTIDLSSATSQIVLSFDAYATNSVTPKSNNSGVGFNGLGNGVMWSNGTSVGGAHWAFDARAISGNPSSAIDISGGHDSLAQMQIVVDKISLEVFGRWNFGAGQTGETPHYSVTSSAINALNSVFILQDFRDPYVGTDFDNIVVAAVPELASVYSLSALTFVACAWHFSKFARLHRFIKRKLLQASLL